MGLARETKPNCRFCAGETPAEESSPESGCPETLAGNFISNITAPTVVPLATVEPILNQFYSVYDYNELGQLGGNLSGALKYADLKQSLLEVATLLQTDSSKLGNPLGELAKSVDFAAVGTILQGLKTPLDVTEVKSVLSNLSDAVNLTVVGTSLQDMSANVDLNQLGQRVDSVLSNMDFEALGVIVASLPNVFAFDQVGKLVSQLVAAVSIPNVGTVLNDEVSYFGNVLATFNSCYNSD